MHLKFPIKQRFLRRPTAEGSLLGSELTLTGVDEAIRVLARSNVYPTLALELESSARRPDRIQTGDDTFDDEMNIRGDPGQLLAILTSPVRARVLDAARAGCTVSGGAVLVERTGDQLREKGRADYVVVTQAALLAAELTQCLRRSTNVPADLRRNARSEEMAGVRLANLRALFSLVLFQEEDRSQHVLAARESLQ